MTIKDEGAMRIAKQSTASRTKPVRDKPYQTELSSIRTGGPLLVFLRQQWQKYQGWVQKSRYLHDHADILRASAWVANVYRDNLTRMFLIVFDKGMRPLLHKVIAF